MADGCWQDLEEIVSENLKGLGEGVNRSLKSFQKCCQGGITEERKTLLEAGRENEYVVKFSKMLPMVT